MTPTTTQHVSHPVTTRVSQFHLTQQLTKSKEKRTHLCITIRWPVRRRGPAAPRHRTPINCAPLLILAGGSEC